MAVSAVLLTQWEVKTFLSFDVLVFAVFMLIYPHLALFHCIKRGHNKNAEVGNLIFDMVLIAGIANYLFYSPALFLPFFFTNAATNLSVGGTRLFFNGIAAFAISLLIFAFLTGFEVVINPNLELLIAPYVYLFAGTTYIGYLSNYFGNAVRKNKTQIEAQNRELVEKSNELLVLNEEINQQNEEIIAQRDSINAQNTALEDINGKIRQSINYAKRIQKAIFASENDLKSFFSDSFVLLMPRDVVSGDFLWFERISDDRAVIVAGDCTGHGVPGAFMSLIAFSLLNEIVSEQKTENAALIAEKLRTRLPEMLHQNETKHKDGLEAGVCVVERSADKIFLRYSAAGIPLLLKRGGEFEFVKPEKNFLGGVFDKMSAFNEYHYEMQKGDMIYLFSDGFQDQFGGESRKKFSRKKMTATLETISEKPLKEQKSTIENLFREWAAAGNEKQTDDVLVVGIKI